jgi:hypothetical protein
MKNHKTWLFVLMFIAILGMTISAASAQEKILTVKNETDDYTITAVYFTAANAGTWGQERLQETQMEWIAPGKSATWLITVPGCLINLKVVSFVNTGAERLNANICKGLIWNLHG